MIPKNQRDFLVNRIVDRLAEYLIQDYSYDLPTSLKIIYESRLYEQLILEESDLYVQSPSYIYCLLQQETNSFT